jgi:hypothetical protein
MMRFGYSRLVAIRLLVNEQEWKKGQATLEEVRSIGFRERWSRRKAETVEMVEKREKNVDPIGRNGLRRDFRVKEFFLSFI